MLGLDPGDRSRHHHSSSTEGMVLNAAIIGWCSAQDERAIRTCANLKSLIAFNHQSLAGLMQGCMTGIRHCCKLTELPPMRSSGVSDACLFASAAARGNLILLILPVRPWKPVLLYASGTSHCSCTGRPDPDRYYMYYGLLHQMPWLPLRGESVATELPHLTIPLILRIRLRDA